MDVRLEFQACSYARGLARQDEVRAALPDHTLHGLAFEHPATFTFGRHATPSHLLVPGTFLEARGVAVVRAERGGEVTFHGPGQLVLYPLFRLGTFQLKRWVWLLEEAMLQTLASYGVAGARGDGPGIFVLQAPSPQPSPGGPGEEVSRSELGLPLLRERERAHRKIGFIGLRVRDGVSTHGISINVNNDLEPFTWMNPCGATALAVTTMARETSAPPALPDLARAFMDTLAALLVGEQP